MGNVVYYESYSLKKLHVGWGWGGLCKDKLKQVVAPGS